MNEHQDMTPRQIGMLIEDLREELEEVRMEVRLLDSRLKTGDLPMSEYQNEKNRLNDYMKKLITRITDLQKRISKKDRDLAREIRQLQKYFQIDEVGDDKFLIYLAPSPDHLYTVEFSLKDYPEKPVINWPKEVFEQIGDPNVFIKPLRNWDPGYPTPIFEIFQAFETFGWKYFNAVQELKNEIREVEGEFPVKIIKDNYLRITLYSYNKEEYQVEVDVENYPAVKWIFTPKLKQAIGKNADDFLERYKGSKSFPKMIELLHDLCWEIDKQNRLAFDYKVLVANAGESINDLKLDLKKKIISGFINGELKTESTRFEFFADFSKGYPEKPPDITLRPIGDVDEDVLGKLQHYISESASTWTHSSFLVDLLNKIHMAIFKSSIITCVICHKLFCPTCDKPLFLPKNVKGTTCYVECANCHRPYHKH
ncbi:MAG: hypothetical protein ACTSRA_17600, partial [Promethearchaeota archaeon]